MAIMRRSTVGLLLIGCALTTCAASTKPPAKGAKKQEHPLIRPVCGSVAACTAEAITMPIDVVKVRMQLASGDSKEGFGGTMKQIVQKEGVPTLFKGLKPALLRQASYQGIKMFLYEPIRDAVLEATTPEGEKGAQPKLWQMILAGGLAGAIGTYITSPTDLIKIRMQSGVEYNGLIDAFFSILQTSGFLSMWDGWVANVQRSFIVNAAELATYDFFKQALLKLALFEEGLLVHTMASSGAGLVAALTSTPVDRAKTLLMTNKEKYGSLLACLVSMAQQGGVGGLYQGFFATWMRLGPWAFLFFVVFEQARAAALRLTGGE